MVVEACMFRLLFSGSQKRLPEGFQPLVRNKTELARKEEESREEAQHQGGQGDISHPWATTRKARPAGVVGRQWLGDNEW